MPTSRCLTWMELMELCVGQMTGWQGRNTPTPPQRSRNTACNCTTINKHCNASQVRETRLDSAKKAKLIKIQSCSGTTLFGEINPKLACARIMGIKMSGDFVIHCVRLAVLAQCFSVYTQTHNSVFSSRHYLRTAAPQMEMNAGLMMMIRSSFRSHSISKYWKAALGG